MLGDLVQPTGRELVIHIPIHQRRIRGLLSEIPLRQIRNRRLHTLSVNQVQHLICLRILEEHHIHPPPRTLVLRAGVGVPGDPARRLVCAHHPISNLIQPIGGLMQLIRRRQGHRIRGCAIVGECDVAVINMSTRQLVQHLPQQSHRPRSLRRTLGTCQPDSRRCESRASIHATPHGLQQHQKLDQQTSPSQQSSLRSGGTPTKEVRCASPQCYDVARMCAGHERLRFTSEVQTH